MGCGTLRKRVVGMPHNTSAGTMPWNDDHWHQCRGVEGMRRTPTPAHLPARARWRRKMHCSRCSICQKFQSAEGSCRESSCYVVNVQTDPPTHTPAHSLPGSTAAWTVRGQVPCDSLRCVGTCLVPSISQGPDPSVALVLRPKVAAPPLLRVVQVVAVAGGQGAGSGWTANRHILCAATIAKRTQHAHRTHRGAVYSLQ